MLNFSTRQHRDIHPVDLMRTLFGPIEVSTSGGLPLDFSVTALTLPSLNISTQESSPFKLKGDHRRDESLLRLTLAERSGGCFRSGSEEVWLDGGDALIHPLTAHSGEAFIPVRWHSVCIARSAIVPLVERDAIGKMRHVPSSIPAIGLLRHYINGLLDPKSPGIAGLEAVVATHIRDLVALVVGANRDGAYQSKSGGVMAARFQMAQHFIAENLLDPSLTDKSVAMALGISPRYLKKLFSGEGGFSNYLVGQRLNFAYRLLTNPLHIRTKVIDIAFRCGFSSLSTFNRRFKNYHGISPSEARLDFMGETDRNSHLPLD